MPPLHRHQLAWLSATGWRSLLDRPWDAEARTCLQHWADKALPLVVTVQPAAQRRPEDPVALGLPAPRRWGRRKFALQVLPSQLAWFGEFPALPEALDELPRADRPALLALQSALHRLGLRPRVYGSAGWQGLTGLRYLREGSDLDLWMAVDDAAQADAAVAVLQSARLSMPLDGELRLPDGASVAWREWAAWRAGRCRGLLVKRLDGARLEPTWNGASPPAVAWRQAA